MNWPARDTGVCRDCVYARKRKPSPAPPHTDRQGNSLRGLVIPNYLHVQ